MLLQDGRKASSAGRCRRTLRPPLRVRDDTCNRGLHAYGVNEIEGLGPCQSALFIPRARACFRCAWRALTISTTHSAYQTRPARPRHALTRSRTLAAFRHRHPLASLQRFLLEFFEPAGASANLVFSSSTRTRGCAACRSASSGSRSIFAHVWEARMLEGPFRGPYGHVGRDMSGQRVLMYCRYTILSIGYH